MELRSAIDLDLSSEDMDNLPEGMMLSIQPPTKEYMEDPMWFDPIGRDPIRARKIFRRWDEGALTLEELRGELLAVMEEWPRYGPAIFEKAAIEGRLDVVELLIEMGAESDPKTMLGDKDGEDEPLLKPEHAYLAAIVNGHLDIVKLLVSEGVVPVDYEDPKDGLIHILYAVTEKNGEMLRWLLDNGATISLSREGKIDDIQATLKTGKIENLKMLLAHPQVINAGFKMDLDHLRYAATSGDVEMVRFVLQSDCYGIKDPDAGLTGQGQLLRSGHNDMILEALSNATNAGSVDCVRLLLKQLTPVQPDGTFAPFLVPDGMRTKIYNDTDIALDREDSPELFEVLWDTILHQPPSQESIDRRIGLPPDEALSRRLISTAAMGRVKTVKLLVEKYGIDVNHVSHKYFSTPLGRAAASGANPLPGRLQVVEYLCQRPELNMELSQSEFCNGETALAWAVQEGSVGVARRHPEQTDMIRVLLGYGGPVDEITDELRQSVDSSPAANGSIDVHVLWANEELRKPVILATEERKGCVDVVLQYSPRDLRHMLRNVKIRSDDETLRTTDPRGRPLMPREGEVVPEEERAKPTFLQDDTVMTDAAE